LATAPRLLNRDCSSLALARFTGQ